jgi:predicted transposase YbfD/YdcC
MSYEEEDTFHMRRCIQSRSEEEDICHMRRRIHVRNLWKVIEMCSPQIFGMYSL